MVELVLIELIPWLDPGAIDDAAASIRAGLTDAICGDERVIRLQAISIIEDGRQRFAVPSEGSIFAAARLATKAAPDMVDGRYRGVGRMPGSGEAGTV